MANRSATNQSILYTLGPSHFSERARWGLDHVGYRYAEHRLALGPHALFLKAKGLSDTTLPVLSEGDTLTQGSGAILDHAGLISTDPQFDARFEREIGPLVRRFIYVAAFASKGAGILDVLLEGVAPAERIAGVAAWPALSLMMRRDMAAPDHFEKVCDGIARQLDWVDGLVENTTGTLAGSFGRNAITAASLLYPLASPTPTPTTRSPAYSTTVRKLLSTWQARPSLSWVRETFAAHRLGVAARKA